MLEINRQVLETTILELGLKDITTIKIDQLIQYANLLHKWNKVYSLTAITQADDILKYHLLDGLTLIPYIPQIYSNIAQVKSIIDVGSGMGVPGVIIAIWCPHIQVVALDSNNKKTTFLQQVAIELKLPNLMVINSRVESYTPPKLFDIVTSRAFADIKLFVQLTKHLLQHDGCFLAMKGVNVKHELHGLNEYKVDIFKARIPGVDLERFLVKIIT